MALSVSAPPKEKAGDVKLRIIRPTGKFNLAKRRRQTPVSSTLLFSWDICDGIEVTLIQSRCSFFWATPQFPKCGRSVVFLVVDWEER